jgi:hypothetical protein
MDEGMSGMLPVISLSITLNVLRSVQLEREAGKGPESFALPARNLEMLVGRTGKVPEMSVFWLIFTSTSLLR